jgi:hypothetical protein
MAQESAMRLMFVCLVFGVGMLYVLYHAVMYTNTALGFG